jgi:hypothetical protein
MTCDYRSIRRDNERRYGTDIGRIGPMLLADRYDDRTHFIYELLQNAEDALARRVSWSGKRSVQFQLESSALRVSHFGKPFDEADVRGVCGIAESTKDLTAIGRFGIGFKSVYAFTDRPEVYSGNESFAIESFVWPVATAGIGQGPDETVVVLPLRKPEECAEIEAGLKRLGPASLLFLRAIEEIEWSVEGGSSGIYLRSQPEQLGGSSTRRVTVIGQTEGSIDVEESWLLFSKSVLTPEGTDVGSVEIAFSLANDKKADKELLRPLPRAPLVVFFPTALETQLGFLVQGPYRTTPSRDNVPSQDAWNRHCVVETADLVRSALIWLRDAGYLDTDALNCLPLERAKLPPGTMFAPIFEEVRAALAKEALLPRHGGGHVAARRARLARTQELRDLVSPAQLTQLLGAETQLSWLDGAISQDRTPDLRDYLIGELNVEEVRPETVLQKLTAAFLESQADDWVRRLYEFLGDQKALHNRARELPIVRLRGGKHVRAQVKGQRQAFLPGMVATDFPTVRPEVCKTEEARAFLKALGLTEPDLVDDVITNLLPRYSKSDAVRDASIYAADIERMLRAYRTDSDSRRGQLVAALREARFVAAREQWNDVPRMAKPGDVYLATERLRRLFAGVEGVLIVDDEYACLKGEDVRELLEACGAVRYLRPVEEASLSWEQKGKLRERTGHPETSYQNDRVTDWSLSGLVAWLGSLPELGVEERRVRAALLWEELTNLEERRGKGVFSAIYTWTHYGSYRAECDAAFVRQLNEKEWISDVDGNLQLPSAVLFDSLGWKLNPFLLSKICFRPPVIDQLARAAGIEPSVLDLLKKLGLTSEAELRQRLGIREEGSADDKDGGDGVENALQKLGITDTSAPPTPDPTAMPSSGQGSGTGGVKPSDNGGGKHTPGSSGGRPFVSYIEAHPDDEGPDPDGLDHAARMALEAKAIELIRFREPRWQATPTHNPGFDLFELGSDGQPVRWCEVKAMTEGLDRRPIGLSKTQFEWAREHGSAYWLYAVERAGTESARIVRIQDPAGKARTFTFDAGWLDVAEADPNSEGSED